MRIYAFLLLLACAFGVSAQESPVPSDPATLQAQLKDYYFEAARRGDVEMLNTFIDAGYSLDTQDAQGYTALIGAS